MGDENQEKLWKDGLIGRGRGAMGVAPCGPTRE